MRIREIELKNFRSFCECKVQLDSFYTAISGKNNAGKSTLLKALRILFGCDECFGPFYDSDGPVNLKKDFPRWLVNEVPDNKKVIMIRARLLIFRSGDENLFKLIQNYYPTECEGRSEVELDVSMKYGLKRRVEYIMSLNEKNIDDEFKKQDIYERICSHRNFYFHNSTQQMPRFFSSRNSYLFSESSQDMESLSKARERFSKALKNVAKKNKEEISQLIGRLKGKYNVEVNIPAPSIDDLPLAISLGDKGCSTSILEWGSGTQNQTNILLTLLRARRSSTTGIGNTKFSPVIVIEEPESFLHPSAQAEFGRLLMDIAKEFEIQIITTTHSIYMLNNNTPSANILIERIDKKGNMRESLSVDMDKTNWMRPFAVALGLSNTVADQWKEIVFSSSKKILFVEGEIDKKYFEYFRNEKHGRHRLSFDGEIYAYNGTGFFTNAGMLKFLIGCFEKVVITFDLDARKQLTPQLDGLGLRRGRDYMCIGDEDTQIEAIEGLLPDWVTTDVCNEDANLFNKAMSNDPKIKKPAQAQIKKRKCELFIEKAKPDNADCGKFYKLIESLNKMLNA